jgi:hypothetical protein
LVGLCFVFFHGFLSPLAAGMARLISTSNDPGKRWFASTLQNLKYLFIRSQEVTETHSREIGMVRRNSYGCGEELDAFAF